MRNGVPAPAPVWLGPVLRAIAPLLPADFVGHLELRVGPGGVTTVSVQQTFRGGDLTAPTPVGER